MLNFVGVDGCRLGWLSVGVGDGGVWKVAVYERFDDLWDAHAHADHILVDVPIGLRSDGKEERRCDKEARRILGRPRGSSVFPAPCRAALTARDHAEACAVNRERTGRGLSIQSWAIAPKIHEVDQFLRAREEARAVVREVHPEILFWALSNGHHPSHNKKSRAGFEERLGILQALEPQSQEIVSHALSRWRRKEVSQDDILDALAGAVTAQLASGTFQTIPEPPEFDQEGLPMEIVFVEANGSRGPSARRGRTEPDSDPLTKPDDPILSARFRDALVYGAALHERQIRKRADDAEPRIPYIGHLLIVAGHVIEDGGSEDEAIAAILHDAIEDQGGEATEAHIRARFGARVAEIVRACSDTDEDPKPPWLDRKKAYLEHLRIAPPDVLRVSSADKLHNARAILRDYRSIGPRLWDRFSATRNQTLWYYRSLRDVYLERGAGLAREIERVLKELHREIEAHEEEPPLDRE